VSANRIVGRLNHPSYSDLELELERD
jgi:hypothetical protein